MLDRHLIMARHAADYAHNIIQGRSDSLPSSEKNLPPHEFDALSRKINKMRASSYRQKNSIKDLYKYLGACNDIDIQMDIKNFTKRAKNFGVGNCAESTALALNDLRKQGVERAERFKILGGDHTFVVIGRAEKSDPNNPDTWGPHAVVCDPWVKQVYPASEIKTHLESLFGFFDPSKHRLVSTFDIGGTLENKNESIINDAIIKLNLLLDAMNQITSPESAKWKESINAIQDMINLFQDESYKNVYGTLTPLALERKLSKSIVQNLKHAQTLAADMQQSKELETLLFANWLEYRQNKYKSQPKMILPEFWHILLTHSDDIVIQLIQSIPETIVNELVNNGEYNNSSLLKFIDEHRSKAYLDCILPRLTSSTIRSILNADLEKSMYKLKTIDVSHLMDLIEKMTINDLNLLTPKVRSRLVKAVEEHNPTMADYLLNPELKNRKPKRKNDAVVASEYTDAKKPKPDTILENFNTGRDANLPSHSPASFFYKMKQWASDTAKTFGWFRPKQ